MSMETLAADLKANLAEAAKLSGLSSMDEVTRHLKDVLWPTLEAVVDRKSVDFGERWNDVGFDCYTGQLTRDLSGPLRTPSTTPSS